MAILMLVVFFLQMIIGIPLFISMLITAFVGFAYLGDWSLLRIMIQQFFGGMDVFALMAIPLFIFAGVLMNKSGLTEMLLEISRALVGRFRGGLGYVNIVASILFAGVNGSAAADTSALGTILIPAMAKEGYPRVYAAGLTAGSSLIGPIIPPSIFMILYATMTNTSIGGLFIAGIIPGLILGSAFMIMNYYYSVKYNFPVATEKIGFSEFITVVKRSLIALVAPFIIIGGISFGVVTPTESGALAVAYVILVGFFITRKLTVRGLVDAVFETARLTSAIFVIMGAAAIIGWLLKWERVPQQFASFIMNYTDNQLVLLLILSSIIFPIGMFMEEVAILVLLTPIFAPIARAAGIDPLQFGIIMTLNVTIALITPPMGACVFIASAVGNVELGALIKGIWPFVAVAIAVLLLIIAFPPLTVTLPHLLGFF